MPRITESKPASPVTGARSRLGNVVRWHAEPVVVEEALDLRETSSVSGTRTAQSATRPL